MSTEPEEALLEQALRRDLPSADAEARVRRRLLAAGVAIGNGMAVTAAAATNGATAAASSSGLLAKALGWSWGVKLGVAAAVTIPCVGLWIDRPSTPLVVTTRAPAPRATEAWVSGSTVATPAEARERTHDSASSKAPREPVVAKPLTTEASASPSVGAIEPKRGSASPSQRVFSMPEQGPQGSSLGSTLADETRLLDGAFLELAAGNRLGAAARVREHEQRYPAGLLLKERERAKAKLLELSRGK